jgi:hypothetical protein
MFTGPISVSTVFSRRPLRELPPLRPGRVVLVVSEMRAHLLLDRALEHRLRQPGQQPALTYQLHPNGASPCHEFPR